MKQLRQDLGCNELQFWYVRDHIKEYGTDVPMEDSTPLTDEEVAEKLNSLFSGMASARSL